MACEWSVTRTWAILFGTASTFFCQSTPAFRDRLSASTNTRMSCGSNTKNTTLTAASVLMVAHWCWSSCGLGLRFGNNNILGRFWNALRTIHLNTKRSDGVLIISSPLVVAQKQEWRAPHDSWKDVALCAEERQQGQIKARNRDKFRRNEVSNPGSIIVCLGLARSDKPSVCGRRRFISTEERRTIWKNRSRTHTLR